jgi:hypothetical protein
MQKLFFLAIWSNANTFFLAIVSNAKTFYAYYETFQILTNLLAVMAIKYKNLLSLLLSQLQTLFVLAIGSNAKTFFAMCNVQFKISLY